jgi:signal transduction histidine kinase
MTAADPKFLLRIVGWQVLFSVGTSLLAAVAAPRLLLLSGGVEEPTSVSVLVAIIAGGAFAAARTWWGLKRHWFVLRALTLGSRTIEPFEMDALTGEVWGATARWIGAPLFALIPVVVWRPTTMDVTTAASVALLAALIVAAASLPLHVLVRGAFVDAIELADPALMREVVDQAEKRGVTSRRVARRLLAALATPVAFVALGSALIANAHLRRADERQREESARALARSALELGPGVVATAGLDEALEVAEDLGFSAQVVDDSGEYRVSRTPSGKTQLTTPLDGGRAVVVFSGSTVPVLSLVSILIVVLVVVTAGGLGLTLGRALSEDLRNAASGVRGLATSSKRKRLDRSARFRVVAELGAAIERLAARFRIFSRAQRQAIRAREAATRMRGLFFASVSHDLKSPLNAILGFAELVRQSEPLTDDQVESLTQIERGGRELLALIETVLDAARVEAGQLSLVREPVPVEELFTHAIRIGHDLGGQYDVAVLEDLPSRPLAVQVDRIRMSRALATFVGQALRTTSDAPVRLSARPGRDLAVLRVEIPTNIASEQLVQTILDPSRRGNEPRGLTLALGLARSVVELHGGNVELVTSDAGIPAIEVRVPVARSTRPIS